MFMPQQASLGSANYCLQFPAVHNMFMAQQASLGSANYRVQLPAVLIIKFIISYNKNDNSLRNAKVTTQALYKQSENKIIWKRARKEKCSEKSFEMLTEYGDGT